MKKFLSVFTLVFIFSCSLVSNSIAEDLRERKITQIEELLIKTIPYETAFINERKELFTCIYSLEFGVLERELMYFASNHSYNSANDFSMYLFELVEESFKAVYYEIGTEKYLGLMDRETSRYAEIAKGLTEQEKNILDKHYKNRKEFILFMTVFVAVMNNEEAYQKLIE